MEGAERVDHRVDRARARLKDRGRVERDPLEAHRFELDHAGHDPVVLGVEPLALGVLRRRRHHALQADRAGIAPGGLGEAADRRDVAPRAGGIGHLAAEPAVAQLADSAKRALGAAADPDRQTMPLRRLGLHRHRGHRIVLALEVDLGVGPPGPQQADRVVHPRAARVEVFAERLVLRLLPAHADAEPHPAARQRIERAHLLGHERRVPLRQHEHLGAERHARGHGGDGREGHQRLEDRHGRRVRAGRAAGDRVAHHDVVEHVDVVVADLLEGLGEAQHTLGPFAIRDAGELDGQLHVTSLTFNRCPGAGAGRSPATAARRPVPRPRPGRC